MNSQNNYVPDAKKMSKRELEQSIDDLNDLAKVLNDKSKSSSAPAGNNISYDEERLRAAVNRPVRSVSEDLASIYNPEHRYKPRRKMSQDERDAEYYRNMSMTQGYDGMEEGLEYQLSDSRIRENNSFFIDESKEARPYWKRDDGDYLRRMDKIWLKDQKDYYQNVSLSYRYPIGFTIFSFCLVFVGVPVLLFILAMMFLL